MISIIIPTYNSEETLEQCLDSITRQTCPQKEVVIVDGGSTDQTLAIIRKYSAEFPFIKWVSEKDEGIYDAMNKGVKLSLGQWVYFLGSDDVLYSDDILSRIAHVVEDQTTRLDFVYGKVLIRESGSILGEPFDRTLILKRNICHQAIFYNRRIFEKFGLYNLRYKLWADYEMNLRCFLNNKIAIRHIDLIVATYSNSGRSSKMNDARFLKDYSLLVRKFGYKTLPLRELRKVSYSKLDFLSLLLQRMFGLKL